ncbi:MAG TPA: GTPase Era [Candidatus Binataceae bacterium]|nr:GTPase Era [Candidatus Binataceae bacterium]
MSSTAAGAIVEPAYRAGFLTLAGRTNVGKSTLLNRLVGHKVAIVTPKPQTTRRRIVGIRTDADAQIVLIDTPGFHDARRPLNRRMVDTARRGLAEGEVIAVLIEARGALDDADRALLAEIAQLERPTIIVINKIDRRGRASTLPLAAQAHELMPRAEIVPVSALTGENVEEFLRVVKPLLPASPALMPADQYTDQTERMIAEEIIREKIFIAMRQEIPFSTAVIVEQFHSYDETTGLARIEALVIISRKSHKGMIIGAGGRTLKTIGTAARLELEELLGRRIFLGLRVKVEAGWTDDPRKLQELGY